MIERPRTSDVARLTRNVVRLAACRAYERVGRTPVVPGAAPPSAEAITPEWLTHALCHSHPGARVVSFSVSGGSSGTSVRRQLRVEYDSAGRAAGLPDRLFVKTTPTLATRIANGLTDTSVTEAGFYRELRPLLDVEAPVGYGSYVDRRSMRSIHLLSDVVETVDASFCSPATQIDRELANQAVDVLAQLHGRFSTLVLPKWLRSYREWWEAGVRVANVRRYHRKAFVEGVDSIHPALRGHADATWRAFVRSVELHEQLPSTMLHGDVHLGNWYIAADRRMGLADWQCCSVGNGMRDLAYALATMLRVDDRRAWERDLVSRYVDGSIAAGAPVTIADDAFRRYSQQLAGALLMWTPTHSAPKFLPDMQPIEVSREMLHRITTAMADLDSVKLLEEERGATRSTR